MALILNPKQVRDVVMSTRLLDEIRDLERERYRLVRKLHGLERWMGALLLPLIVSIVFIFWLNRYWGVLSLVLVIAEGILMMLQSRPSRRIDEIAGALVVLKSKAGVEGMGQVPGLQGIKAHQEEVRWPMP